MCVGHGIRFVTVRHALVVAGENRPFSDVSATGGGDVCVFASRGRANRESACLGLRISGLGLSGLVLLSWALCLGLLVFVTLFGLRPFC